MDTAFRGRTVTACPYCGKDVPRGTLNRHMRQDCPKATAPVRIKL
jgi:hypothetical protein